MEVVLLPEVTHHAAVHQPAAVLHRLGPVRGQPPPQQPAHQLLAGEHVTEQLQTEPEEQTGGVRVRRRPGEVLTAPDGTWGADADTGELELAADPGT